MDEILKCCGEEPVIYDFSYDLNIPLVYRNTVICTKCGHHIHSEENDLEKVIAVWNNSSRKD